MERNDKAAIEALLKRHGFHFSKSMGQNFLIDPAIPYEIAESSRANEQNGVLEIGPGIGALSHELCERAGKVVAVELDKTLLPILDETMARFDNFEVVSADILKTDIPALVREKFAGLTPIVCANLPYNITTPAITALIESKCFESITVLVQKEVAERLCAAPGTSAYGAFSVFMQYYTEPELLFAVPRECFEPQPKVTSRRAARRRAQGASGRGRGREVLLPCGVRRVRPAAQDACQQPDDGVRQPAHKRADHAGGHVLRFRGQHPRRAAGAQ